MVHKDPYYERLSILGLREHDVMMHGDVIRPLVVMKIIKRKWGCSALGSDAIRYLAHSHNPVNLFI